MHSHYKFSLGKGVKHRVVVSRAQQHDGHSTKGSSPSWQRAAEGAACASLGMICYRFCDRDLSSRVEKVEGSLEKFAAKVEAKFEALRLEHNEDFRRLEESWSEKIRPAG